MIFLLGRQAMLGQEPPTYFRSITATCFPFLANVHATYLAPSPLPSTTMSCSFGLKLFSFIIIKTLRLFRTKQSFLGKCLEIPNSRRPLVYVTELRFCRFSCDDVPRLVLDFFSP